MSRFESLNRRRFLGCCVAVALAASAPLVRAQDAENAKMPGVLLLDPSDKVWSLQVTSGSKLTVDQGDIIVNSTHKSALWNTDGTIEAKAGQIRCAGGMVQLGKRVYNPAPILEAAPADDPIGEFRVPQPPRVVSQEKVWLNYEPEVTLPPGIYMGGIRMVGNDSYVTLQPGTYVMVNGDFFASGVHLRGKDVTIVLAGDQPGSFWMAGDAQVELSAPTEGPLKNMLLVSRAQGWNKLQISGGKFALSGLIYAPEAGFGISAGADIKADRIISANLSLALKSSLQISGKPTPISVAELQDKPAAPPAN